MQRAANEAADPLDAMARRLTLAADEMRQAGRNATAQAEFEAKAEERKWLRGAEKELALQIREEKARVLDQLRSGPSAMSTRDSRVSLGRDGSVLGTVRFGGGEEEEGSKARASLDRLPCRAMGKQPCSQEPRRTLVWAVLEWVSSRSGAACFAGTRHNLPRRAWEQMGESDWRSPCTAQAGPKN
jgi:hypothetical protein